MASSGRALHPTRIPGGPNPALYGHGGAGGVHAPITVNIHTPAGMDPHGVAKHVGPVVQDHVHRALRQYELDAAARFHDLLTFGQGGHGGLGINLASP
jgi:hypothetical protein